MNSLFQATKAQDNKNFDQTKETFIDKLKNYQNLTSFTRTSPIIQLPKRSNSILSQTVKQKPFAMDQHLTSPRFGQSLSKRLQNTLISPKNSVQEFKFKLYGNSTTCPQTSCTYLKTKFTTQQKYFDQEFDKYLNQLSNLDGKFQSYKRQQQQTSRQNYVQLDNVEKFLISAQKVHQSDFSLISQKSKQLITETLKNGTQIIKTKHKTRLQNCLKTMTLIDQQSQSLKQGIVNQSQLCEHNWCQQLDKINEDILTLNTLITQTRLQENDRFTDAQWKIKEMQFCCEQAVEKEHKDRIQKESRLYSVLQKLIQRVGNTA